MSGTDAVERFWELPELVRNLLPCLDAYSIASLGSIHELTIRVLQEDWGHSFMRQLIKESGLPCNELNAETLEQNRVGLRCLANLLIKMKNPMELLLTLLEMICDKCPRRSLEKCVQLSCPAAGQCVPCLNDSPHSVTALGFILLEEVEGVFGSVEQRVEKILLPDLVLKDPWLTALGSRVSRQEEMMMKVDVCKVECRNLGHARAFHTLVQKSPVWQSNPEGAGDQNYPRICLKVLGRIGPEGWSILLEAIKQFHELDTNPSFEGTSPSVSVHAYKHVLQEAKQQDLRTIWDWNSVWLVVSREDGLVQIEKDNRKFESEQGWGRLVQMLYPSGGGI